MDTGRPVLLSKLDHPGRASAEIVQAARRLGASFFARASTLAIALDGRPDGPTRRRLSRVVLGVPLTFERACYVPDGAPLVDFDGWIELSDEDVDLALSPDSAPGTCISVFQDAFSEMPRWFRALFVAKMLDASEPSLVGRTYYYGGIHVEVSGLAVEQSVFTSLSRYFGLELERKAKDVDLRNELTSDKDLLLRDNATNALRQAVQAAADATGRIRSHAREKLGAACEVPQSQPKLLPAELQSIPELVEALRNQGHDMRVTRAWVQNQLPKDLGIPPLLEGIDGLEHGGGSILAVARVVSGVMKSRGLGQGYSESTLKKAFYAALRHRGMKTA